MRIPPTWSFTQAPIDYTRFWLAQLIGEIGQAYDFVQSAINGRLSFGDGTDIDNIKGKWVEFTSHATPDTEFTVTHDLGAIPVGFIDVGYKDKAGVLYRGGTTWTTSSIFLKCNVASTACRIFLLLGPDQP
jgi:hypothetical protein